MDIDKELSVIVARNSAGETEVLPSGLVVFDPVANLVDYLTSHLQRLQLLRPLKQNGWPADRGSHGF